MPWCFRPGRLPVSEETTKLIDAETRHLVEQGQARARAILTEHADQLHLVAKALLEHETLTGEDIEALLKGHPPQTAPQTEAAPIAAAQAAREARDPQFASQV